MIPKERRGANQIYHVYNRGVDKRKIFLNDRDYLRCIHDLFEFNDEKPAFNAGFYYDRLPHTKIPTIDFVNQYMKSKREPRKLIVEIMAFCLMPNHFHLLLKPLIEGGLTLFMRKFGCGYANYFNKKYERSGALFQGRYKAVRLTKDSHFIHIPYYIHLNPLDLVEVGWRERKIENLNRVVRFLDNYRWSSHLDYTGKKNFPSVTQREFLLDFFGGPKQYQKELLCWLKEISLSELEGFILE